MFRTFTSMLDACRSAATVTTNVAGTAGDLAGALAGAARDAMETAVRGGSAGVRDIGPECGRIVSEAERAHGTHDEGFEWSGGDRPADNAAFIANTTALVADLVGVSLQRLQEG